VSYNTREILRDCLLSMRQSGAHADVIVVDNASVDGSPEMVLSEFPEVRLIQNTSNVGFAKANNQGIREAGGKYILLLNSDTVVRPAALEVMARFLEANSQAGGATCRLLNADGSIQACVSGRPSPMLLFFRFSGLSRLLRSDSLRRFLRHYLGWLLGATVRSYLDPYAATDSPREVANISGACLMLRREVIDQVGLLDENFFMYFEDMDYCLRLHAAGWKLYYVPCGEIIHLSGRSSGGRMRDYSIYSYLSLFYFYRKHYSRWTQFVVQLLVLLTSFARWTYNMVWAKVSASATHRRNQADLMEVICLCLRELPPALS
jgi:GT2 family glycosyltransferase